MILLLCCKFQKKKRKIIPHKSINNGLQIATPIAMIVLITLRTFFVRLSTHRWSHSSTQCRSLAIPSSSRASDTMRRRGSYRITPSPIINYCTIMVVNCESHLLTVRSGWWLSATNQARLMTSASTRRRRRSSLYSCVHASPRDVATARSSERPVRWVGILFFIPGCMATSPQI